MHLTLVLPELLWPEPGDKAALENISCPALEWLIAHGAASHGPAQAYENALAAVFGFETAAPFGALRLLGETLPAASGPASPLPRPRSPQAGRGESGVHTVAREREREAGPDARQGFWLCADPVHLRFHHERIILADAGAFELAEEEAHALVGDLNREFADVGEFHLAHRRRWYVRLAAGADFAAPPLSAVAGRRIEGEELEGKPSRLRTWLNEVQMFLHAHPVNAARAAAGQPAVNSLWLWGAGEMPAPAVSRYAGVWADDPLARGLALAAGMPCHAAPERLADLLAAAPAGGGQLLVLDDLLPPVLYEDAAAWREALQGLEERWFAPLRPALGRQVAGLALVAPTLYGRLAWEVKAGERWKFWRRPQALAATAAALRR